MSLPLSVEIEIRRLFFAEHWPVGTVAHQLGVHEEAVRRVLGLLEPRPPLPPRPRVVDPFVGFIEQTLRTYPRLRATRLHDMLRERGFAGAVRTLRRYVATVRPLRREVYLRVEPLIGEQTQIDWAHVGKIKVEGGERSLWLFVAVLSWSRALWGEFVFDTTVYSLLRSLTRAGAFFGGTTRQWLFDNAKVVVLERAGGAVRFHPLLLDLAGHYRVALRLCTVRAANQKGRVERAIRYLRDRFLAGRNIRSVEQGNRELAEFVAQIAHPRSHPSLAGRTVEECFAEEKTKLLPLPNPVPSTDVVIPVSVDNTAFVHFDANLYSVPPDPENVGHVLTLVADDHEVRVLRGADCVARHDRCWGRKQTVEEPSHRAQILATKPGGVEPKGRDRLRAQVPGVARLFEQWVEAGRNLGSLTAATLRLLDLYGKDTLAEAVDFVLARGSHDVGALAQVCEQLRRTQGRTPPIDIPLGDHVPDRDVIPHDLETYDAKKRRRD
jgi:transposase